MTPFQRPEGLYVAAIFTAKVTHWKKKCNLYESFIFIFTCVKGEVLDRAEENGRDLPSVLTLNEAWRFRLSVLPCSYRLGCMLCFLLRVLREFTPLIFLAMEDAQQHRQGKQDGEQYWSSHLFLKADGVCPLLAGLPGGQQVILMKSHRAARPRRNAGAAGACCASPGMFCG